MKVDENDHQYSHVLGSVNIENCRAAEGVFTTIFIKMWMENFSQSFSGVEYKCPFLPNITHKVKDNKITDNLIPTSFGEKQVKVENKIFGIVIKNNKRLSGWRYMYMTDLYVNIKK
jgi:hypothetical protein